MASTTTQFGARQLEDVGVFNELVDIEERLRSVETELELLDDKQEAHIRAKRQDARDKIQRGDVETVVVVTPPDDNDGRRAVSKIEGIVTFVDQGDYDLERGDVLRVRIFDVGKNHADSLVVDLMEDSQ